MKIPDSNATNPLNSTNVSTPHRVAPLAAGVGTGRPGGGLPQQDRVEVSALSQQLSAQDLQPALQSARLSELSSVVSAGRYQVDAQVLSGKIIQEHVRTAA